MKKFILSATLLSLSFLTFSFKSADKSSGDYDIKTDLNTLSTGMSGSWSKFYSHKTDKDVVWSEWHTHFELTSTGSDLEVLSQALSKY